jgi:hypothetical protein
MIPRMKIKKFNNGNGYFMQLAGMDFSSQDNLE